MRKIFCLLCISFFMLQSCSSGDGDSNSSSVKDVDANTYETAKIFNQTWMRSNLNVSHYRNGDEIPQVTDPTQWSNLTTGAWCYYENKTAYGTVYTYKKLYNWYAVNDPRGLAPLGWHLPSDEEWKILTTNFGGENVAGSKMKSLYGGCDGPNIGVTTNSNGFAGFAGGCRQPDGSFYKFGAEGYWWSSSEYDTNRVWFRLLSCDNSFAVSTYSNKTNGFSVRCVKD